MSNWDCILFNAIQIYRIYCVVSLFTIDLVDDEWILPFVIPVRENDNCASD